MVSYSIIGIMYRRPARYFKVVHGGGNQLSVWRADAETDGRWSDIDFFGSESECWNFVEEQESRTGYIFTAPYAIDNVFR
jgi:uncharacterized protein YbdZ (MbtH family)